MPDLVGGRGSKPSSVQTPVERPKMAGGSSSKRLASKRKLKKRSMGTKRY